MSVFDGLSLPKTIFETHSDISGHISVVDYGSTRRLRVQGLTQSVNWNSPVAQKMYYGRALQEIKESGYQLTNMMILGFGGGTLPHLLSKEIPGILLVSVEVDPVIVEVSQKYFDAGNIPNHHLIVDDALKVLAAPQDYNLKKNSFDSLFVDIYCGETYPELGTSGTFMSGIKNVVKPGGLVMFNRIYWEHHQYEVNAFIDSLEEHFSEVKSIIVAGKTNSDYVLIFGKA